MGPNDVSGVVRARSHHRRPLSRSSCITTVYTIRNKLVFFKKTKKNERNPPMAQTTHLASFGPVFVVSAHPVTYFVFKNIYTIKY